MIHYIMMKIKNFANVPVMIIMTAMTLVFIYVFGIGFSKPYVPKAIIVDQDQSQGSKMIVDKLRSQKGFRFTSENYKDGISALENNTVIGVVFIAEGFEQQLELGKSDITFYKSGSSLEQVTLQNSLGALVSEVLNDKNFSSGLSKFLDTQGVTVSTEVIYKDLVTTKNDFTTYKNVSSFYNEKDHIENNQMKRYFAGFMLFFSMFIIMFGVGGIVEEKQTHVWQRQLVSPLPTRALITGNLISNFIVSMGQLIVVVLIGKFVFGIDWGGSTVALLLILSAYVIAGSAMGLFISGFVKTQQQLSAVLPTIVTASSMIGGCMWPLELMKNKFLRNLADLLPQRWGMEGLGEVLIYNGGVVDVIKPIVILLIIASVFLIAAVLPYKKTV